MGKDLHWKDRYIDRTSVCAFQVEAHRNKEADWFLVFILCFLYSWQKCETYHDASFTRSWSKAFLLHFCPKPLKSFQKESRTFFYFTVCISFCPPSHIHFQLPGEWKKRLHNLSSIASHSSGLALLVGRAVSRWHRQPGGSSIFCKGKSLQSKR